MAIDVCSDIQSPVVSPRISFSHDLKQTDDDDDDGDDADDDAAVPIEPTIDFDFCIRDDTFPQHVLSADELFADGKILPVVQVNKVIFPPAKQACAFSKQQQPLTPLPVKKGEITTTATTSTCNKNNKKMLKEFLSSSSSSSAEDEDEKKPSGIKPFWQFRRSSSLNCEKSTRNGLIRSLQFLTRSNSTGSAPNHHRHHHHHKPNPKITLQKQHSQREPSRYSSSSSSSSTNLNQFYASKGGRTLKKSYSSNNTNGHGVRIAPVLNITPNLSIGTLSLFGFCSFFTTHSKSKKKNK